LNHLGKLFFNTFKLIYSSVLPFVRGLLEFLKVKGPKTEKFDIFVINVVSGGPFLDQVVIFSHVSLYNPTTSNIKSCSQHNSSHFGCVRKFPS
jgi:hypothetical protein